MNHKKIILFLLITSLISCINENTDEVNKQKRTIYDLSLDELIEINIIQDKSTEKLMPTYDIPIKDLIKLEIIKELHLSKNLSVSYNIPMEDLKNVEIPIRRKDENLLPTYEMSINGLLEFEIKENYQVQSVIKLSYDLSIEGLMEIDIMETADEN